MSLKKNTSKAAAATMQSDFLLPTSVHKVRWLYGLCVEMCEYGSLIEIIQVKWEEEYIQIDTRALSHTHTRALTHTRTHLFIFQTAGLTGVHPYVRSHWR